MARRISTGISGRALLGSFVAVNNSFRPVVQNQNIVFDPGTGKLISSSQVEFQDTTASTTSTTGSLVVAGGVGISGDMYTSGNINLDGNLTDGNNFSTNTQYVTIPSGDTANRPGTPAAGYLRFNTDYGLTEVYNGTKWVVQGFQDVDVVANRTAKAYENNWVTTSGGAITITLPTNPSKGDEIRFFDVSDSFDTNALSIVSSADAIMTGTIGDPLVVQTQGAAFSLVFYNSSAGWRILTI